MEYNKNTNKSSQVSKQKKSSCFFQLRDGVDKTAPRLNFKQPSDKEMQIRDELDILGKIAKNAANYTFYECNEGYVSNRL